MHRTRGQAVKFFDRVSSVMTHASRLRCDKSRRVGGTARRGAHIMRRSFENATSTWSKEFELSALRLCQYCCTYSLRYYKFLVNVNRGCLCTKFIRCPSRTACRVLPP